MQIDFHASDEVRQALVRIGRTEDLAFSPDGRRLAIAGFARNRILVIDVELPETTPGDGLHLTGALEISSPALAAPHGVDFLDADTLVVANRAGLVTIFALPPRAAGAHGVTLAPRRMLGGDPGCPVSSPGSVSVATLGCGVHEVLVCNNYVHRVTRHIVDAADDFAVRREEVLLGNGLDLPDGVATDRAQRWIAISSHNGHGVLLFANTTALNPETAPAGLLVELDYPHGLCFTPDGRHLLVADAGAQYINVYRSEDGDWQGTRSPLGACRLIGEDAFLRGRHHPAEGGIKGIDIEPGGRLLAATCEHQPLVFFELPPLLQPCARPAKLRFAEAPEAAPASARRPHETTATRAIVRTAPCPCGSGKRYKHCCGARVAEQPADFPATMARALDAQRARKLPAAEALYREALRLLPGQPDALHMLGMVLHGQGRHHEAQRLVRRAGELTQWSLPGVLHNHRLALGAFLLGRDTDTVDALRKDYRQWLSEREAATDLRDAEPLVSVVLLARGRRDRIAQTLASVYAQTWHRLELVVVVDGRADDPPELIGQLLRDCPLPHNLLVHAGDGMPNHDFVALEQAIGAARGSWINPLESGDRLDPGRISSMVERVARCGFDWGFARCEGFATDETHDIDRVAAAGRRQQLAETCDRIALADTVGAALLAATDPVIALGNLFFSSALHRRLGGFDQCTLNPVRHFCLRALWLAEPCFVPAPLYHWRVDPAALAASSGEHHYAEVQELLGGYFRRALSEAPPNGFAPARTSNGWRSLAALLASGHAHFVTPDQLCRISDECASEDRRAALRPVAPLADGLNLIGYFRGDFGLAESVRAMATTCREGGIAFSCHDAVGAPGARGCNRSMDGRLGGAMAHRNTLIHLNPGQMEPTWWHLHERGELRGRHVIGCWYWELDAFPARWRPALERVDEIWTASAFMARMIGRATAKPVIRIPHAIDVRLAQPASRADFGLPEEPFLFLFSFDFSSYAERKNPQAVLRAFRRAFAPRDTRVGLVIKCLRGHRHLRHFQALLALAAEDPRIRVIEGVLPRQAVLGLHSVCDAFVSLHRAEGLGLGMAESMALGKPVIATGYSGNLEFMNADNSCLVDYRLVPVRPGQYIDFEPGWQWAEPCEAQAADLMRRLVQEPDFGARIGARAATCMAARFSHEAAAAAIRERLAQIAALPSQGPCAGSAA